MQAINFSVNLQTPNGTIPWSIDKNGNVEEDYLLTGSASILKSIECALALSNILNDQTNIKNWKNSYESLSDAIKNPDNKFDLLKDRKNFSMDWYYPILSGCLDTDQIDYYEKIFWPTEQPSWTAAALILSADSIFNYSKGSDIFLVNNSILY